MDQHFLPLNNRRSLLINRQSGSVKGAPGQDATRSGLGMRIVRYPGLCQPWAQVRKPVGLRATLKRAACSFHFLPFAGFTSRCAELKCTWRVMNTVPGSTSGRRVGEERRLDFTDMEGQR